VVQLRRLDPLANAGPYQRLMKSPVKSFSLTEVQFERVRQARPELVLIEGECGVVGRPFRDFLEVHYGFPDVEVFEARFEEMFERVTAASSKAEAPRGVLLSFRDRPNRIAAEQLFWRLGLSPGAQWVEMSHVALPELPPPAPTIAEGFVVREVVGDDAETIGRVDAEATGFARLSRAAIAAIHDDAKALLAVAREADGSLVGYVSLRIDPGGWGVIESMALAAAVREALRGPVLDWCFAWLRNNGGRRVRRRALLDDPELPLLRERGFTAGETGIDFTRPIDPAELKAMLEERRAHGTVIKFGDWR
jgi:hypothetical protein